jgi:hypothetical protein
MTLIDCKIEIQTVQLTVTAYKKFAIPKSRELIFQHSEIVNYRTRRTDMPEDKESKKPVMGEISFGVSETISGVFGEFSSLEVHIGLKWPGSVDNFETEIDKMIERTDDKVKEVSSRIAVLSGYPNPWLKEEGKDAKKIGKK